jgi:hypothetical protein
MPPRWYNCMHVNKSALMFSVHLYPLLAFLDTLRAYDAFALYCCLINDNMLFYGISFIMSNSFANSSSNLFWKKVP